MLAVGVGPVGCEDGVVTATIQARDVAVGHGATILFSGLIVGISLSGLMLFEAQVVRAIGAAGVSVVVVALVVALTLVPALCSAGAKRLGRRRGVEEAPDEGVFSRLAAAGQRPCLPRDDDRPVRHPQHPDAARAQAHCLRRCRAGRP